MIATKSRPGSRVLDALAPPDLELIKPHLESVQLPFRQRLQSENRRIQHVYFLESGLGSVVASGGSARRQAEVGVLGREGMTGMPVLLRASRSPCEIFMQIEGRGQRILVDAFTKLTEENSGMRHVFLQSTYVFTVQAHYTALANAHGKIEERLCRWLLMAHDRIGHDTLELTHDFLALMLGVRRAGVTGALNTIENRGYVSALRGAVTIVDREGLEECAHGFYGQPEAEFERLFGAAASAS